MIVRIFDRMEACTEAEVERLLPLVSVQRREQALKFRHTFGRFACLKTYEMLMQMTGYGLLDFGFSEKGKPFLRDHPEIHFSISHCPNGLAVAVSKEPVGIDIESFRKADDALLDYCMNPEEAASVRQAAEPAQAFSALWTRKEAVLKLRGTGITGDLHRVLSGTERTETFVNGAKAYVYSTARFAAGDLHPQELP